VTWVDCCTNCTDGDFVERARRPGASAFVRPARLALYSRSFWTGVFHPRALFSKHVRVYIYMRVVPSPPHVAQSAEIRNSWLYNLNVLVTILLILLIDGREKDVCMICLVPPPPPFHLGPAAKWFLHVGTLISQLSVDTSICRSSAQSSLTCPTMNSTPCLLRWVGLTTPQKLSHAGLASGHLSG
jgi:hypothetical protein